MIFAPGVVTFGTEKEEYIGNNAQINSVNINNNNEFVINTNKIDGEKIEFGYSLTNDLNEIKL